MGLGVECAGVECVRGFPVWDLIWNEHLIRARVLGFRLGVECAMISRYGGRCGIRS